MVAYSILASALAFLASVSASPIAISPKHEPRGTELQTHIALQHGKKSWVVGLRRFEGDNCQWAASYEFNTAEEVINPDGLKDGLVSFQYTADDDHRYTAVPIGEDKKMNVEYEGKVCGSCVKPEVDVKCTSDVNNSWYVEKPWVCTVTY